MSKTPTPLGRPEKTLSSRLLTMKFMQRAAVSSSSVSPPSEPIGPPSKRRRLSNNRLPTQYSNHAEAVQTALDAEDDKISTAINLNAEDIGDSKWILSYGDGNDAGQQQMNSERAFRVLNMGYSEIDRANETIERQGRRSFGNFNKGSEKRQKGTSDSSSSSSSSPTNEDDPGAHCEDDDTDASEDPTTELIRQSKQEASRHAHDERKAQRKAEKAKLKRLADTRRSKKVKLNRLSSISGGGHAQAGTKCYLCGEIGHKKSECPRGQEPHGSKKYQGVSLKKGAQELDY